jgi:hypothetical protein
VQDVNIYDKVHTHAARVKLLQWDLHHAAYVTLEKQYSRPDRQQEREEKI